jgi:hypothetical protein
MVPASGELEKVIAFAKANPRKLYFLQETVAQL